MIRETIGSTRMIWTTAIVAVVAIMVALILGAVGVALVAPQQAHASLQAQSVTLTLPGGAKITVPNGTKISGKTGKTKVATTATKKANKYWTSGIESKAKAYGWKVKKTWTSKSKTKAVRTATFTIPAALQKQGKSLRMTVVQTTWKSGGKWHDRATVGGKAYEYKGIINTLRDYGKK